MAERARPLWSEGGAVSSGLVSSRLVCLVLALPTDSQGRPGPSLGWLGRGVQVLGVGWRGCLPVAEGLANGSRFLR